MPSKAGGICSPPATIHHLQNPKWPTESGKGFNPRLLTVPNKNFCSMNFLIGVNFPMPSNLGGQKSSSHSMRKGCNRKKKKLGKTRLISTGPKKHWFKIFWSKKTLYPNFFESYNILSQRKFGSKKFLSQKSFLFKRIWVQKWLLVQKIGLKKGQMFPGQMSPEQVYPV